MRGDLIRHSVAPRLSSTMDAFDWELHFCFSRSGDEGGEKVSSRETSPPEIVSTDLGPVMDCQDLSIRRVWPTGSTNKIGRRIRRREQGTTP